MVLYNQTTVDLVTVPLLAGDILSSCTINHSRHNRVPLLAGDILSSCTINHNRYNRVPLLAGDILNMFHNKNTVDLRELAHIYRMHHIVLSIKPY